MKVLRLAATCLLVAVISSCNQDEITLQKGNGNDDAKQINNGTLTEKPTSQLIESPVPAFVKPNSTVLNFQVEDPNGFRILAVKFYDRATTDITYVTMTRSGKYWKLDKKMEGNGWYDWRYVYKDTKTNISDKAYVLCSTYNTFNSTGVSSIRWPFGADGSSWKNRTVYVNGKYQSWISGIEDGKNYGGNGREEDTHNGFSEKYAVDWNRNPSDLGSELRSPLDGTILFFNTYATKYGIAKQIAIEQVGSNKITYKFFFAHLASFAPGLYRGMPIKAGITKLGTLGSSGATSPHAHCSMRNNETNESVKFEFDAQ